MEILQLLDRAKERRMGPRMYLRLLLVDEIDQMQTELGRCILRHSWSSMIQCALSRLRMNRTKNTAMPPRKAVVLLRWELVRSA